MKTINLLPNQQTKELKLELLSNHLVRFFLIIILSLLLIYSASLITKLWINAQIAENNSKISDLQTQLASSNNQAVQKEVLALNTELHNLKTIKNSSYSWSQVLTEIGNLSPSDFHYDLITADRTKGIIMVTGTADNRGSVLDFWSNVKKSDYFQDIDFPLANLEAPTDTPFTFSFHINPDKFNDSTN